MVATQGWGMRHEGVLVRVVMLCFLVQNKQRNKQRFHLLKTHHDRFTSLYNFASKIFRKLTQEKVET